MKILDALAQQMRLRNLDKAEDIVFPWPKSTVSQGGKS
jgi:hypothetical protein